MAWGDTIEVVTGTLWSQKVNALLQHNKKVMQVLWFMHRKVFLYSYCLLFIRRIDKDFLRGKSCRKQNKTLLSLHSEKSFLCKAFLLNVKILIAIRNYKIAKGNYQYQLLLKYVKLFLL